MPPLLVRFGQCVLDEQRRELKCANVLVPLQPKVLEVLIFLVKNRERAVTRDEIFDAVWPDVVVGPSSLSRAIREVRKAIGDDDDARGSIRTLPGHGFRFVGAVEEVTPRATEVAPPVARRVALHGRELELAWLEAAVERSSRGRAVLRLVAGEAGIGKTHLLDALANVIAGKARVLRGRVSQADAGAPLGAFRDVAAELGIDLDDENDDGLSNRRRRRVVALREGMKAHAEGHPTVVLLDDVDRADASSLRLVEDLVDDPDGLRLCVVGTLRSTSRRGPDVARTLARALRDDPDAIRDLSPLGPEDLTKFLFELLGRDPSRAEVASVHRLSGGHPLFARHLVHATLRARGELETIDVASLPRGGGLRELVLSYVTELAPHARDVLEAASILRLPFSADLVADVADARPTEVADAFQSAIDAGFLELVERGRHGFVHELVREVVSEALVPSRAAVLHRRAARALDRRLGRSPEHLEVLTLHYVEGAPEGDADRALEVLQAAAEHAMRTGAFDVASRHFATALDVEALLAADAARRATLYLEQGKALARDGHFDEAAVAFRAAHPEHWQGEASALQAAFHAISSVLPSIVERFYEKLFSRHPAVKAMFKREPAVQRRMFGETLVALVEHADDSAWLDAHVTALGRRHAGYAVEERMYDWVREALLDAIGEASGREGLPEVVRATWARTYDQVAAKMIAATRAAREGVNP